MFRFSPLLLQRKFSGRAALTIVLLFIGCSVAEAQYRASHFVQGGDFYFHVNIGISNALVCQCPRNFTVAFPYTLTDANGNTSSHMFNSNHYGLYNKSTDRGQINYITLEVGNRNFFINTQLSGNIEFTSSVINFGRNIILNSNWVAKLSLGINSARPFDFHISSTGYDSLGSIDLTGQTLQTLGKTYAYSGSSSSVNVYYIQKSMALVPRISIGQGNFRHLIYWDLFLEYYLPIYKKGGLVFFQNNIEPGTKVWLDDTKAITGSYDGHSLSHVPTPFKGFYFGFSIGINLSKKDRIVKPKHPRIKHYQTRKSKKHRSGKPVEKENKDTTRGW